jgi:hypothetical protein
MSVIDEAGLERRCIRLIQGVDRERYSAVAADSDRYRLLDASVVAIGWMYMDLDRAVVELESALSHQRQDGALTTEPGAEGLALPLVTSVARMIYHAARGRQRSLEGRLARMVQPLDRFHEALLARSQRHLFLSGPADGRLLAGRPALAGVARQDVGYNALLVQAESDLADVAIHTGFPSRLIIARRTKRAQALADRLWWEQEQLFASRHEGGRDVSGEALLPLWAGAAPGPRARAMVKRHLGPDSGFWARRPLGTLPAGDPDLEPAAVGRGAVSPLLDWLMVRGLYRYGHEQLAGQLNEALLRLASEHGFWEGYDSQTGEGVGAPESALTAALVLDLIKTPYTYDRW